MTDYEKVAKNLAAIGDISANLKNCGLSDSAVLVLLKHKTGIPMTTIQKVLDNLGELSLWALAKKK